MKSDITSEQEEILIRLQKLEYELRELKAFLANEEMAGTVEIKDSTSSQDSEDSSEKSSELIERERIELLQRPEIKDVFDKIDRFLQR